MNNVRCLCGYSGSGKTNIAINWAIDSARCGNEVLLVDCDLDEPYFRPSMCKDELEKHDIELISPLSADKTVNVPLLPETLYSIFTQKDKDVIIDVGDSENGVKILRRFSNEFEKRGYELMFVLNYYRLVNQSLESTVKYVNYFECNTSLKVSSIVNNSNLKNETTKDDIIDAYDFAKKIASRLDIPIKMNTVPSALLGELVGKLPKLYPIDNYLDYAWDR